ncbi:MAG: hypothetical protein AAFV96_08990, partial [Pseudomonadota bacterium]
RVRPPGHLPPVTLFTVAPPDADGDIFLTAKDWHEDEAHPPVLYMPRQADPALAPGDTVLADAAALAGQCTFLLELAQQLFQRHTVGPLDPECLGDVALGAVMGVLTHPFEDLFFARKTCHGARLARGLGCA